jgi:hypothetical protein
MEPSPECVGVCGVPLLWLADDCSHLNSYMRLHGPLLLLLLLVLRRLLLLLLVCDVHDMALEPQEAANINRLPVSVYEAVAYGKNVLKRSTAATVLTTLSMLAKSQPQVHFVGSAVQIASHGQSQQASCSQEHLHLQTTCFCHSQYCQYIS